MAMVGGSDSGAGGRVSALQYDASRLLCAFTLGYTAPHAFGQHIRRGCIRMFDLTDLKKV